MLYTNIDLKGKKNIYKITHKKNEVKQKDFKIDAKKSI